MKFAYVTAWIVGADPVIGDPILSAVNPNASQVSFQGKRLSALGNEGWELCSVVQHKHATGWGVAFLKKRTE